MSKRVVFFTLIIIACIASIGIGIYTQITGNTDVNINGIISGNTNSEDTVDEKYKELKYNFNSLFTSGLVTDGTAVPNASVKQDAQKEYIYTGYEAKEQSFNKYDVNVKIPVVNLTSELASNINKKIEELFGAKAKTVLEKSEVYTIYNVEYASYINKNILSLTIKATLKEGTNAQRVMIQTYNYNMTTNQEVDLYEMLVHKNINQNEAVKQIKNTIKYEAKQASALKEAGYTVYERDINSDIYELANTDTFFLGKDNYLYLIYAYGNKNYTTEFDTVIF